MKRKVPIKVTEITAEDIEKDRIMKIGEQTYRLTDTEDVVALNTGIVKAYNIVQAVDLIKLHPVGAVISDSFKEWPAK